MAKFGLHVVMIGNAVDGLWIIGPFKTGLDAVHWATGNLKREAWEAAPLEAPEAQLIADAAEASERFGDDECEAYAANLRNRR